MRACSGANSPSPRMVVIQNLKSASKVEGVYLFKRFEDGCYLAIHQMFLQSEAYLPAKSKEEWYLVDKEDVKRHVDLLVKLEDVLWDSYKVSSNMGSLGPCCLALQSCYALSPDLVGCLNVFRCDGAVLDVVGSYDPFKFFDGGISNFGIELPCLFGAFNFLLGVVLHVFLDGAYEDE